MKHYKGTAPFPWILLKLRSRPVCGGTTVHGNTKVVLWDERTHLLHEERPRYARLRAYLRNRPHLHVYRSADHPLARNPRSHFQRQAPAPATPKKTLHTVAAPPTPEGFWELDFIDEL